MLGDELSPARFGDLMVERAALLLQEYQEVNAHLRANTNQFVNWFSFFLTLSLLVAGVFATAPDYRPALGRFAHHYGVQVVSLLMHIPVFVGIFTFRRYIIAAHQKIEAIIQQLGYSEDSPIPARFCQWMEWAPGAGQVGGVELTGAPGFRRMEAHDEASIPQYRVQTPDCPGVLGW
jgi:AraC-like DNA-binding protein